jgi:uncharacterized phage protein (TIGR02220 family)
MARIRYLKPDFFKDDDLATLPFEVRLFFAGLWNFADKAGRLEDRPIRLKAEIFPYDKVDVEKCLQALNKPKSGTGKPYILRYEIDSCKYIQIINWEKHQKPHHTEKDSIIPPYNPLLETKIMEKEKGMESVLRGSTELSNVPLTVIPPLNEIIVDFNDVFGTHYKTTTKVIQELVNARIKDKFTVEDFKVVHRKMLKAWGNDEKMAKYLRPITLYGTKFESYLQLKEGQNGNTERQKQLDSIGEEV